MKTRLSSAGLVLLLAACSGGSQDKDDNDGVVVINNATNSNGSPNNTNVAPNNLPTAEPLNEDTIVFTRGDGLEDQIVALDVAAGSETVITDLADSPAEVHSASLSPGRDLIAFSSYYRIGDDDLENSELPTPAIWVIDVDGEQPTRILPHIPGPPSTRCSTDADCDGACLPFGVCETNQTVSLNGLSWSADGTTVYFEVGNFRSSGGGIVGGTSLGWVDVETLESDIITPHGGCSISSSPTAGPDGGILAIVDVCTSISGGIVLYESDFTNPQKVLDLVDVEFDLNFSSMDSISDKSGLAFSGWGVTDGELTGHALLYADFNQGTVGILSDVLENDTIHGVAVSPDDTKLAFCRSHREADDSFTSDLWLLDSAAENPAFEQLTTDGASCDPTW